MGYIKNSFYVTSKFKAQFSKTQIIHTIYSKLISGEAKLIGKYLDLCIENGTFDNHFKILIV